MDPRRRQILIALGGAGGGLALASSVVAVWRLLNPDTATQIAATDRSTTSSRQRTTTSEPPAQDTTLAADDSSGAEEQLGPAHFVDVICRDGWGAKPATRSLQTHTISAITIHHSAVVLSDNRTAPSRVRGDQAFHQGKGFADIAYHFVIDANGNCYEGRALDQPGESFTDYDTSGHLLLTCEGNFEEQTLPPAQLDALAKLTAWGASTFNVPLDLVRGHRDLAPTACPGKALYQTIADGSLRLSAQTYVDGGVTIEQVCGEAGQRRVAAIEAGQI